MNITKKTLRVLHSSDLHGRYDKLLEALRGGLGDYDVWIDTGDFLPNRSWANRTVEIPFQSFFISKIAPELLEALGDRRFLYVSGNHDFIKLSGFMKNAETIDERGCVNVDGIRFAGFRHIAYIIGDWEGEIERSQFEYLMSLIQTYDPHVLLTHTPPGGILDYEGKDAYGVHEITMHLSQNPHKIQHHFFGHVHGCGGIHQRVTPTTFYNGALNVKLHTIEVEI